MYISRWYKLGLILLLFCVSCGDPLPTFENINLQIWKDDKLACSGKRASMLEAFAAQTDKLLALQEQEVIQLLGKPDENELYKRNQKFYYYFLQPAAKCSGSSPDPKKLVIRFNAIGLAKEVAID